MPATTAKAKAVAANNSVAGNRRKILRQLSRQCGRTYPGVLEQRWTPTACNGWATRRSDPVLAQRFYGLGLIQESRSQKPGAPGHVEIS